MLSSKCVQYLQPLRFNVRFHVIVLLENYSENDFTKYISGDYQCRSKSYIYYSDADIFIQKLWKMAYDSMDIQKYQNTSDDWQDNYICDIRELEMPNGIYEVFKYCFKDMDIKNLDIFRDLYFGLKRKRLRQGYGELYNIKVDDRDFGSDDSIKKYLEFKDEEPEVIAHKYVRDMTEKYGGYKKVSVFKRKISK